MTMMMRMMMEEWEKGFRRRRIPLCAILCSAKLLVWLRWDTGDTRYRRINM